MVPASARPNRVLLAVAFATAAAMAAALLVEGWAARAAQNGDTATALALRPNDVPALVRGATDAFGAHRPGLSQALARAALEHAPLNVVATRTLGFVADHRGDLKRAAALMNQSARLSWRDTPTQAWLFKQALLSANIPAIVQRGDALLRRNQMQDSVYAAFAYLATTDEGRGALAGALAYKPEWRFQFLRQLEPTNPKTAAGIIALFDTMNQSGDKPSAAETAPFLTKLIEAGYAVDAAKLERRITGEKSSHGLIGDADFSGASSDYDTSPFGWRINVMTGAQALPGPGPDGKSGLTVQEDGSGADGFVTKYLGLPPGRYRFRVQVYSDSPDSLDRLRVQLQCAAPREALATMRAPAARDKWLELSSDAVVPPDCGAESIVFSLLGGGVSSGTLYFRGATLSPEG